MLWFGRNKDNLGRRGEKLARKYLKKQGLRHLRSNFRIRQGEIDLIMQQDRTLVFVEVKARRSEHYVPGEEAVNHTKRQRLTAAARHFIQVNNLRDRPCRFDVVIVLIPPRGKPIIRHWPNAFAPTK